MSCLVSLNEWVRRATIRSLNIFLSFSGRRRRRRRRRRSLSISVRYRNGVEEEEARAAERRVAGRVQQLIYPTFEILLLLTTTRHKDSSVLGSILPPTWSRYSSAIPFLLLLLFRYRPSCPTRKRGKERREQQRESGANVSHLLLSFF